MAKNNIQNGSPVCFANANELREEFKDKPKEKKTSAKKRKQNP